MPNIDDLDYLVHKIAHSDISVEEGLKLCSDERKRSSLIARLVRVGLLSEADYHDIVERHYKNGVYCQ